MNNNEMRRHLQFYFDTHWPNDEMLAEWYVDPAPNQWRFDLRGETVTLTCHSDGVVTESRRQAK